MRERREKKRESNERGHVGHHFHYLSINVYPCPSVPAISLSW